MTFNEFKRMLVKHRQKTEVARVISASRGLGTAQGLRWLDGDIMMPSDVKPLINEISISLFGEGVTW